jgi:hypothetical protein
MQWAKETKLLEYKSKQQESVLWTVFNKPVTSWLETRLLTWSIQALVHGKGEDGLICCEKSAAIIADSIIYMSWYLDLFDC